MKIFDVQGIAYLLRRIQQDGGERNFFILYVDVQRNKYMQFAGAKGSSSLYGEAVGNENLAVDDALRADEIAKLYDLGWGGQGGNFWQRLEVSTSQERLALAQELMEALVGVYGLGEGQGIEVTFVLE